MTTHDFVSRIREAPAKRFVFNSSDGATIHGGYDLTELKAASFDTVDCGAQKNQWNEMIVQLRLPQTTCKARDGREAGAACCG